MATFTVHEPSQPQADRVDRADELRFVKDGFSWVTAICPPLGFAMKGLWTAALAYIVFAAVAVTGLMALHVGSDALTFMLLAINIYLGFESSTLERWSLDNDGWRMISTVIGRNISECERRFFESWLPSQPVITGASQASKRGGSVGWPSGVKS